MSNNKQSSVEWLIEHYTFADLTAESWEMIQQQAKAMHKDETIDFAMKFMMQDRPVVTFYNETFNNNEQH